LAAIVKRNSIIPDDPVTLKLEDSIAGMYTQLAFTLDLIRQNR
jgi:hypothetical protein